MMRRPAVSWQKTKDKKQERRGKQSNVNHPRGAAVGSDVPLRARDLRTLQVHPLKGCKMRDTNRPPYGIIGPLKTVDQDLHRKILGNPKEI